MKNILLFCLFTTIGYLTANKNVSLDNLECRPREHYVEVDEKYRYHLHMIKLHRCFGRVISHPKVQCKPIDKEVIDIQVINHQNGELKTLHLDNHTKCSEKCTLDSTICNKYQSFDEFNCMCQCDQTTDPNDCENLSQWDAAHCKCRCPYTKAYKCDKGKLFDEGICGCKCRKKIYKDCSKQNKYVDEDTCQCTAAKVITGKSIDECKNTGISKIIVIVVVVFEAMCILICYYLIDKYFCKKRIPKCITFSKKSYEEKDNIDPEKKEGNAKEEDNKSAHSNDVDKEECNPPKKLSDNVSVSTDTLDTVVMNN